MLASGTPCAPYVETSSGNPEVAELLGPSNCLRLIEKGAMRQDVSAAAGARRRVPEVHAGIVQPPAEGEPQPPLYAALMAVTSESGASKKICVGASGAEEAKRMAGSMKCVAKVRRLLRSARTRGSFRPAAFAPDPLVDR